MERRSWLLTEDGADAVPLWPVTAETLDDVLAGRPPAEAAWARAQRFKAKPGTALALPGDGTPSGALVGMSSPLSPWDFATAAAMLPRAIYRLEDNPRVPLDAAAATHAALGWALGGYRFARYKKPDADDGGARLVWPALAGRAHVERTLDAVAMVRDLVNTPAGDMGTGHLAAAALDIASATGAAATVIEGGKLLDAGYPLIHAVGRAGPQAPRLVDIRWGDGGAPRVTLVGKGVCFDSGGLDIKPAAGMQLMKKDMGGAATALGLAHMVMDAHLPVNLRVLLPIVENAVDSDAYHPGDVLPSRKGLTVEIGNTDAEGRLVLADALAEADSESPEILLDFATLTGSARAALGPEVPALFTPDDALAADLAAAGVAEADPVWRMPLWDPYAEMLDSKIADIDNAGQSPFAGAITAALFLRRFVTATPGWAHFDLYAWNPKGRPGRPEGGEAQVLRAAYRVLAARYGS